MTALLLCAALAALSAVPVVGRRMVSRRLARLATDGAEASGHSVRNPRLLIAVTSGLAVAGVIGRSEKIVRPVSASGWKLIMRQI